MNLALVASFGLSASLASTFGIETMQVAVVAVTLLSLLLLSWTALYKSFRLTGGLLVAASSTPWIIEQLSGRGNVFGPLIEQAAHHGSLIAVAYRRSVWAYGRRIVFSRETITNI